MRCMRFTCIVYLENLAGEESPAVGVDLDASAQEELGRLLSSVSFVF